MLTEFLEHRRPLIYTVIIIIILRFGKASAREFYLEIINCWTKKYTTVCMSRGNAMLQLRKRDTDYYCCYYYTTPGVDTTDKHS